ncbi:MAG: hypothetical protein WBV46_10730 [Terriglobales bacterium]
MGNTRQFELLFLRLVPHALRDDFMTVGVVVIEAGETSAPEGIDGADPGARFADLRITRDWKRLKCLAPDFEIELFENLEVVVREQVKEIRGRQQLVQLLESSFGSVFEVGPAKAMVAEDPVAEMRVLERDYLAPMSGAMLPAERALRMGRLGIGGRMQDAFAAAGVMGMLQRDLEMKEFTGENDPFRVDFGFRVGKTLKMFHALALNVSREPAVTLAYRYSKIQSGMRARGADALMTAIINEDAVRAKGEVAIGLAMLRENQITVRDVGQIDEIAEEVRRELRA